jgi:hypothetical protein
MTEQTRLRDSKLLFRGSIKVAIPNMLGVGGLEKISRICGRPRRGTKTSPAPKVTLMG